MTNNPKIPSSIYSPVLLGYVILGRKTKNFSSVSPRLSGGRRTELRGVGFWEISGVGGCGGQQNRGALFHVNQKRETKPRSKKTFFPDLLFAAHKTQNTVHSHPIVTGYQ